MRPPHGANSCNTGYMGNEPTPITGERRARRASSFGAAATAYAEHRPDYPIAALRWGLDGSAKPPREVVDLGAGTGKLTLALAELGLTVTAVEPDQQMLTEPHRLLPSISALTGHAERIPLETASADAVFVGQAFHWFDVGPALDESRASAAEELPGHPNFAPSERETFRHSQRRTAESLVRTLATHSHVLAADGEESTAILRTAQDFLARRPETVSGEFDRPMITTAFRARRR